MSIAQRVSMRSFRLWLTGLVLFAAGCDLSIGSGDVDLCFELPRYTQSSLAEQSGIEVFTDCPWGECPELDAQSGNALQHAQVSLAFALPAGVDPAQVTLSSSDKSVMRVEQTGVVNRCKGVHDVTATLTFDGLGDADLRLKQAGKTLVELPWHSFEAKTIQLQVASAVEGPWKSPKHYDLHDAAYVRVVALNADDEGLVTAGLAHFWVDDPRVASLLTGGASSGRLQTLVPVKNGTTVVHAVLGNVEKSLQVTVHLDADGGDGGASEVDAGDDSSDGGAL
ncbi:MAG TPA: hypothetical protein VHM19_18265 [Polyangiales bacterium]|jgi:hypothetical protein|nr:hypothetical protein [Polyangiales bacterium]